VFSNRRETVDFLIHSLPKSLVSNINFGTLKVEKTSYIDEKLKENFPDMVFNCKYKSTTDILITLLLEHKSYVVEYPHLQLLKYLLKIWEANLKQNESLTPVIPVIVYHGKGKWKVRRFEDYFQGIDQDMKSFLPSFDYLVKNFSSFTEEEIVNLYQLIMVHITLFLLKNIFDEDLFLKKLQMIFSDINMIAENKKGEEFIIPVTYYLFSKTKINSDKIIKTI